MYLRILLRGWLFELTLGPAIDDEDEVETEYEPDEYPPLTVIHGDGCDGCDEFEECNT